MVEKNNKNSFLLGLFLLQVYSVLVFLSGLFIFYFTFMTTNYIKLSQGILLIIIGSYFFLTIYRKDKYHLKIMTYIIIFFAIFSFFTLLLGNIMALPRIVLEILIILYLKDKKVEAFFK